MIPWHLCLSVRGGVVGVVYFLFNPPPHHPTPEILSHIYDTLTFYVWVSGWDGGGGWLFLIEPPPHHPHHPKNLSYIYDTLTFYVWVSGWGGGGSIKKWEKKILQISKTECWAQDCRLCRHNEYSLAEFLPPAFAIEVMFFIMCVSACFWIQLWIN